jgi:hypothetical protein
MSTMPTKPTTTLLDGGELLERSAQLAALDDHLESARGRARAHRAHRR